MSAALIEEAGLLRGHTGPADAKSPVSAAAKQADTLRKEWARVAEATDSNRFYVAHDRVMVLATPTGPSRPARLWGLATSPPATGEGAVAGTAVEAVPISRCDGRHTGEKVPA